MNVNPKELADTLAATREHLLKVRAAGGYWPGRLSSSALATATAVAALASVDADTHAEPIRAGLQWLARGAGPDGGWGDSPLSASNLPATLLAWSAFAAAGQAREHPQAMRAAERYIADRCGSTKPNDIRRTVLTLYGTDRTFSVPILAMCALAGRLGPGGRAWRGTPALPFELAALPRPLLAAVGLPVVSYALPALIAVGQARFACDPPGNPLVRLVRKLTRRRTLAALGRVQPPGGGFLEAIPLTSFVVMCLVVAGQGSHQVVAGGTEFLLRAARRDGSWPIDTGLPTWCTTLSVNAFAAGGRQREFLDPPARRAVRRWLLGQQHDRRHPYTGAEPGGWAWTDSPGGPPEADDTAGALIALRNLGDVDDRVRAAAFRGVRWLLRLQNRDGGMPTFCRGWTKLPFDRGCADLTAHALRALAAWRAELPPPVARTCDRAIRRGLAFLARTQAGDGSWRPLWFGSESDDDQANPVYGTSRVVVAACELAARRFDEAGSLAASGAEFLLNAQNDDGGFGAAAASPSTIEGTALALEALAAAGHARAAQAQARAAKWLIERTGHGRSFPPAPIGLYFARLWYYEDLYPVVFTLGALERLCRRSSD